MFNVTSKDPVLPCPVEIKPIRLESEIHTVAVHALCASLAWAEKEYAEKQSPAMRIGRALIEPPALPDLMTADS